jgi:hypothetical protein
MSDLDRLLQQVEELKKLATQPDDSWMDNMSNEELRALGRRVRKVADGLSGLQGQLQQKVPSNPMKPLIPRRAGTSGSLGSMVKRDQGSTARPAAGPAAPARPQPSRSPFPAQQANEGVDLSNPMQRRRHAPPREAPSAASHTQPPAPQRPAGETPPPGKHGGRRPNF